MDTQNTRPETFQSKTWFLTGATGLVGYYTAKILREADINVLALVRENSDKERVNELAAMGVNLVVGDLMDAPSFELALASSDVVVHAAAAVQVRDKKTNWRVNVEGTNTLLKAMEDYQVHRLIHISTVGVYGITEQEPIAENAPNKPIGHYAKSKLGAEKEVLKYQNRLRITIFRPPLIIGNCCIDRHVLPTIYKVFGYPLLPALWRKKISLAFVHVDDLASAVLRAGVQRSTPHLIYNVQSFVTNYRDLISMRNVSLHGKVSTIPVPYLFARFLALIADLFRMPWTKDFELSRRLKMISGKWAYSTKRLEQDLGWRAEHNDPELLHHLLIEYETMKYPPLDTDIRNIIEDDRDNNL